MPTTEDTLAPARTDTVAALTEALAAVKPALDPAVIRPDSSLTADLGLGSLDLVELATRLAGRYGTVDLAPWIASAMRPGGDTVGSLASFLDRQPGRGQLDYLARARELAPVFAERAAGYDAAGEFPTDNVRELVRSGYTAMTVPTRYGGGGASLAELCQAQRILAAACGSTAFAVNMHVHGLAMIAALDDPRYEWIFRAVVDDGAVIAGGFSEPGVGGNWWYPTSTAEPVDGGYRVSGRKSFFTGFPGADLLFLSASRRDELGAPVPVGFLVPRPERGVTVTGAWDAAGMRATGSHALRVDDLFIDARYRIGDEGDLPMIFLSGVHWAWCSFASVFLGIAEGALEVVARTQRERRLHVIDRPLAHLPGIQFKVAEMATKLAAARAYLSAAIDADHSLDPDPLGHYIEMSLMKVTVCRLAHQVVTLAMQVQGGSGLLSSSPLQRMYRDVVAGLLVPPAPDLVEEWAGKQALGVPVLDEPRWGE